MTAFIADKVYGEGDQAQYQKDRAEYFRERGLCVKCGEEKDSDKYVTCLACRMYIRDYVAYYREEHKISEEAKAKQRANHKQVYWETKAQGICTYCHKRPAEEGKVKCAICLGSARARERIKREQELLYQEGICYRRGCNEPCYKDFKSCKKHYAEKYEQMIIAQKTSTKVRRKKRKAL